MSRTNKHQEPFKNFVVKTYNKDSNVKLTIDIQARTHWEAIDKAYTRLQNVAPDRSLYEIAKPEVKKKITNLSNKEYFLYLQELQALSYCLGGDVHL